MNEDIPRSIVCGDRKLEAIQWVFAGGMDI